MKSEHYIDIQVLYGEVNLKFRCASSEDAPCRTRPDGWEDMDSWSGGTSGYSCWAEGWVSEAGWDGVTGAFEGILSSTPVNIAYAEGVEVSPVASEKEDEDA